MRQPTPLGKQLDYWRACLNGAAPPTTGDEECLLPQPGYYKIRAKAWSKTWLPARVSLHQEIDWQTGELTEPEMPMVEIAGKPVSNVPGAHDLLSPAEEAWLRMRPVTLDEWKWLTARAALHSAGTARPTSFSA